jgi:hypothetical chaperone protein
MSGAGRSTGTGFGVGIDFGTTNSAVAIADDRGVRVAHFGVAPEISETFRSVLYFPCDFLNARTASKIPEAPFTGPEAISKYLEPHEGGRLIQSVKSLVASRVFRDTQIGHKRYRVEDLAGLLLRGLRIEAEKVFGDLGSCVLAGRPVRFASAETKADEALALTRLREAYRRAGFTSVTFEYEPVGAAWHYESSLKYDEIILIADFGGGTSDFSLLRVGPGVRNRSDGAREVLAAAGLAIAGDAFDARIIRNVVAPLLGEGTFYRSLGKLLPVPASLYLKLEKWHHLSFLKSRETIRMLQGLRAESLEPEKLNALIGLIESDLGFHLHRAVQKTKFDLTTALESEFLFEDGDLSIKRRVTRADFESWIKGDVDRISTSVEEVLDEASLQPGGVDRVFLTGGSSLVPAVRRVFEDRFGAERVRAGGEFTSVARGLAIRAAQLVRSEAGANSIAVEGTV